jgi:hypothetical protein
LSNPVVELSFLRPGADEYRHRVWMALEYPSQRSEKHVMTLITIERSNNSKGRAAGGAGQELAPGTVSRLEAHFVYTVANVDRPLWIESFRKKRTAVARRNGDHR